MKLKKYACRVCGRRFRTLHGLADHETASHGAPAQAKAHDKRPVRVDPRCMECGSLATLTSGEAIYPHRPDLYSKRFYLCDCGAYCGCHPNSIVPLGFPCGPETRRARSAAHAAFDPLWKRGSLGRRAAYEWLAAALGIDTNDCHIAMMTADQARQVVALVNARTLETA